MIPKGKSYDYLRPKGEITTKKDQDFDVVSLEIKADSWYISINCLWPKQENQIKFQFFSDRTPYCLSISTDNSFD